MLERLNFLIAYVGSAALVAFLAVCLSSPRTYAFACHPGGANGAEKCELAQEVAITPEAGDLSPGNFATMVADGLEPATAMVAAQHQVPLPAH